MMNNTISLSREAIALTAYACAALLPLKSTAATQSALDCSAAASVEAASTKESVTTRAAKDQLTDPWVVPPFLLSGTVLPSPSGFDVSWSSDGLHIQNNTLTNTGDKPLRLRLTGRLRCGKHLIATKQFNITLLDQSAVELFSYSRNPTDVHDANQPVIARSLHLAFSDADRQILPLNRNYGVAFAKGDYVAVDRVVQRGILNPALFYFADGSIGAVATRVQMSGEPDKSQTSSVLLFKASVAQPGDFVELGLLDLGTRQGVNAPSAVWDSASKRYLVAWTGDDGVARWTTVADLARTQNAQSPFFPENHGNRSKIATADNVGEIHDGLIVTVRNVRKGNEAFQSLGTQQVANIPVSQSILTKLQQRFGRIVNTKVRIDSQTISPGRTDILKDVRATLEYSDGSTAMRAVDWNEADLTALALAGPGEYQIHGTVRQRSYPKIFAYNRADPTIYRYDRGGIIKYIFIATDDSGNNNIASQHLPIRVADSISELSDLNGGREREVDLLNRIIRRDVTNDGKVIAGCYWAPELHEIDGRLSILFAPCFNVEDDQANEGGAWSTVQAHIMQLNPGGDPANPLDWSKPAAIRNMDGKHLGRTEFAKKYQPRHVILREPRHRLLYLVTTIPSGAFRTW